MITESNAIEVGFPQISNLLDNEIHQHPDLLRLESQINSLLNRVSALEKELGEHQREKECRHSSSSVTSVSSQLLASIGKQADADDLTEVASEPGNSSSEPANEEGVACLKRQLHEQLRSAELEMSRERARVFQQRAELEELKIKLAHDRCSNESSAELNPESRLDRHVSFLRRLTENE